LPLFDNFLDYVFCFEKYAPRFGYWNHIDRGFGFIRGRRRRSPPPIRAVVRAMGFAHRIVR
jgi:hypothetical protein